VLVVLLLVRCHCVTYVTGTVTVIIKELVFFLWLHILSVIIVLFGLHCKWLWFVYRILSVVIVLCSHNNFVLCCHWLQFRLREAPPKKSALVGDIVRISPDLPSPSCGQLCDLSFSTRYPQKKSI